MLVNESHTITCYYDEDSRLSIAATRWPCRVFLAVDTLNEVVDYGLIVWATRRGMSNAMYQRWSSNGRVYNLSGKPSDFHRCLQTLETLSDVFTLPVSVPISTVISSFNAVGEINISSKDFVQFVFWGALLNENRHEFNLFFIGWWKLNICLRSSSSNRLPHRYLLQHIVFASIRAYDTSTRAWKREKKNR